MSAAVPRQVRDEDVFKGLDNMVKNFLVSMPLVADLRSPAMRPRHWQQLMETTKASLSCACRTANGMLAQLRALQLIAIWAVKPMLKYCELVHKSPSASWVGQSVPKQHCSCELHYAFYVPQVTFNVEDPTFKLADLLALELHKFEDEVSEIVDRAQKEEKMEFGLKKLEDVWAKMAFQFTKHKDSEVFTVKMAEEDFEVRIGTE